MDTLRRIVALRQALRDGDLPTVNRILNDLEASLDPEDFFNLLVELFSTLLPLQASSSVAQCA